IVDKNGFSVETIPTYPKYLKDVASSESSQICQIVVEKSREDTRINEANIRRDYIRYTARVLIIEEIISSWFI
ncbi:hypothetical protein CLU79DRAFT_858691, partial [Phycomyces nitens]